MNIQRKFIMIKYWLKLLKSNRSLPSAIYQLLLTDTNNELTYNGKNWAYQIKHILDECGLSYLWEVQDPDLIDFKVIKNRILDIYKQTWYTSINNSKRLEYYSMYKHEFKQDIYLNKIQTNKFRIALSRFRLSSHDLAIEKGRHTNIPRENRKCTKCTMNCIESEYHFLLVCPVYRELRIKYFKPYYCHWPTLHKFESLMSIESPQSLNNVSKFIYHAMKLRKNDT